MIAPLKNWDPTRTWLGKVIALRESAEGPATRVTMTLNYGRLTNKQTEALPAIRLQDEDYDVESLMSRIVEQIEEHCDGWDPMKRVTLRLFCYRGNAVAMSGKNDHFAVEPSEDEWDADETDVLDERQPHGDFTYPASQFAKQAGVPNTEQGAVSGNLQFMGWALLELVNQTRQMQERTLGFAEASVEKANQNAADSRAMAESMHEKWMEAQLGARTAQIEADAEKAARATDEANAQVKRDLIQMFGGNLTKIMQMMMLKATGVPPDSPELMEGFIRGFIAKNPEQAKQLAASLGLNLNGEGFNPKALLENKDALDKVVRAELERDPHGTLETIGGFLDHMGELALEYTEKLEQEEAGAPA